MTVLELKGLADGLNAVSALFGFEGGLRPPANPGTVLVNGVTQALAEGMSFIESGFGYIPGNAIFNSGPDDSQSSTNDGNINDLESAANQPFKGGQTITNAGRALTKHPNYFGFDSTPELRQVYRSDAQLNQVAADAVQNILQNGTKTTGAGGRYPDGWVTYTLPDGRAASWTTSGEFIGFRGGQK